MKEQESRVAYWRECRQLKETDTYEIWGQILLSHKFYSWVVFADLMSLLDN